MRTMVMGSYRAFKKDQQGRRGVRAALCVEFIPCIELMNECGDVLLKASVKVRGGRNVSDD